LVSIGISQGTIKTGYRQSFFQNLSNGDLLGVMKGLAISAEIVIISVYIPVPKTVNGSDEVDKTL